MATKKRSASSFITVDKKTFDPGLASLFASSLGPVKPPPKSRYRGLAAKSHVEESSEGEEEDQGGDEDDAGLGSDSEPADAAEESESRGDAPDDSDGSVSEQTQSDNDAVLAKVREAMLNEAPERPNKKRKRGDKGDDVEGTYMQKIVREEARDEEKRKKKQKTNAVEREDEAAADSEESDEATFTIPKHETLAETNDTAAEELEKAARTVFLSNVSNDAITSKAAEKKLIKHLSSFIDDLADNKPPHKVESIRFRSTAFASALPKRAAFAKKEVMDATTKCTNAYVVYSTKVAAREAVKRLNGSVILGRHLRVDSIAHPAKVDHRRCVFVGNLGFVDDESKANEEDGKKSKPKPPSDVEEGLWVQFSKAGKVESVRVPRDAQTRVGKGFAYVQFEDENGVEAALEFNDQKFPPLLPRKLRVTRARPEKRKEKKPEHSTSRSPASKAKYAYQAKVPAEQKAKEGRARAMLGKAAAFKTAESFVFEGHRASSSRGKSGLKLGGKKKKGPNGRKSRSQAWKKSGGKK